MDSPSLSPPSPPHRSPAMRIYRHALEAILGMLTLSDLSQILAVSREWAETVRSMKPISASIVRAEFGYVMKAFRPLPAIASLVGSPLLRHLVAIHIRHRGPSWTPLNNASLGLLAHYAPNLQSLQCTLTLTAIEPLIFPAKLTSLQIQLDNEYSGAAVNGVLTVLASLPSLTLLHLQLSVFEAESSVELSLLAACRSLTDLTLVTISGGAPDLTDAQLDQVRLRFGHLQRLDFGWKDSDQLARFLQPPVTARWQDIGRVLADERTGDLLVTLPTLTTLDLSYDEDTAQVDFLPQLPLLTTLKFVCHRTDGEWRIPPEAVFASIVRCRGLTDLDLSCGFNSEQWSELLTKLPLKKLKLDGRELETLQFFATDPIAQSLEELTMEGFNLSPSEVSHLFGLRRLRTLRFDRCFSPRLDDAAIATLSPPSSLLPALTLLFHRGFNDPHFQS